MGKRAWGAVLKSATMIKGKWVLAIWVKKSKNIISTALVATITFFINSLNGLFVPKHSLLPWTEEKKIEGMNGSHEELIYLKNERKTVVEPNLPSIGTKKNYFQTMRPTSLTRTHQSLLMIYFSSSFAPFINSPLPLLYFLRLTCD